MDRYILVLYTFIWYGSTQTDEATTIVVDPMLLKESNDVTIKGEY